MTTQAHPPATAHSAERCETCRFWPLRTKIGDHYIGIGGYNCDGSVSDCRRRAPVIVEQGRDERLSGNGRWPTTKRDDWCGEYEARPVSEAEG